MNNLMSGIRRTKKTQEEKERDFYQTPLKAILILKQFIKENESYSEEESLLDPCAGTGIIGNQFFSMFKKVEKIDKYPKDDSMSIDFLKLENVLYDRIVMNPPYKMKKEFIRKALKISEKVYAFLPLQVMNYIDFTEEFLDSYNFKGKIVCYPKMILDETQNPKQGGTTAYAWFIWDKNISEEKFEVFKDMRKIK